MKFTQFKDPVHGIVTVKEGKNFMMMTNAKPDTKGHWVKRGNSYTYELYKRRKK